MATDTGERFSPHLRSVTVTTTATVAGLIAGVASSEFATSASDPFGVGLLAAAILGQFPLYYALGLDVSEFSTKDQIYVAFMTFTTWFVAWGILLTAGTV